MTDETVAVEQCDRNAAADLTEWLTAAQLEWEGMPLWFDHDAPAAVRRGAFDSHEFVQSHARHRIAALASAPAPDDAVVETVARALDKLDQNECGLGAWDDHKQQVRDYRMQQARAVIAALLGEQG